jgi:hypothetical protein
MALIEVEIKNVRALAQSLRAYPKIAEPVLQRAVDATNAVFAKHSLKDDPIPWRTGNLLHSFRFQSGRLQGRWFPTARYAPFVEYGRGYVYPKQKKVLSWVNQSGQRVFAKFSRPSKPRPFMNQILEKSQADVQKLFRQAGDIIIREIGKLTR